MTEYKQVSILKTEQKRKKKWPLIAFLLCLGIALGFLAILVLKDSGRTVIVIDPGHGGLDIGAQGIVTEAEMNERAAKHLYKMLKSDKRFKPVYSRKFNANVKYTLADRLALSNRVKANLLISIHGNSSSKTSVRGFECYAAPPGRKNHEASVRFATSIANKMGDAGHTLRGETGVRFLYYVESEKNGTKRDIRESSYTNSDRSEVGLAMVENPNCPAVLVEQCFINNREDYEQWGSEVGAKKSAQIYYEAICDYFSFSINL